jgi:protein-L-isoaspartate(D-aspartate) O-methyltransferase
VKTPGLEQALAMVPRERFLRPGPWLTIGAGAARRPPTPTLDADPRHVYDDVSVAIDAERQLFNGAPSFLTRMIDLLSLTPGDRVLHVGAGLGYYSALMAHVVGAAGRVFAVEVDADLAAEARERLMSTPPVEVIHGDGASAPGRLDAILVNAGVTHPQTSWLDALAPGGRLLLPLTVTIPAMGATLGKGVMLLVRHSEDRLLPEVVSFVAIYSALALRDPAIEADLAAALRRTSFPNLTAVRRDAHERADACWLHAPEFCLSMEPV